MNGMFINVFLMNFGAAEILVGDITSFDTCLI